MDVGKSDNFVQEKAKMASERIYIPYMEMKSSRNTEKGNAEPSSQITSQPKQNKEEARGLSLQLGEEYERKKQRLKEELRHDYRRYVTEKDFRAGEVHPKPTSLSLPIRERSEKTVGKDTLSPAPPSRPRASLEHGGRRASPSPERALSSRREAGTGTEPVGRAGSRAPRRHWVGTHESQGRRASRRTGHYSAEEEEDSEEEEELERLHRRRLRFRQEPPHAGERRRERKTHHRTDRAAQKSIEAEGRAVNEVYEEERRGIPLTALKSNTQAPPPAQARAASRKNMAAIATGLLIGTAEEEEAAQRRKERYRQELLEQMAEQQQNRRKEKELELRVAATGAVDPEKQPDRIKLLGAARREHEGRRRDVPSRPGPGLDRLAQGEPPVQGPMEREPPERPRVAFQSPILEYSAALGHLGVAVETELGARLGRGGVSPFTEDFHKGLSGALGDMVVPRVPGTLPPAAPSVSEILSTPYDEAYYYYGARNPLDPNLTYCGRSVGAVQPDLPAQPSTLQPPAGVLLQSVSHQGSGLSGTHPAAHQQTNTGPLSYKDALKQQIEERQERRRREREELVRYDAKLEAEMKSYEPWGRGGGGAPLRDDRGNLISDLKRMHRSNEAAYINPEPRHSGPGTTGAGDGDGSGSRPGDKDPSSQRVSGFSFSQASPYGRGNVFSELPTPQQLWEQDKYKESLKQQIEEKRKMEAERRERLRLEEERQERRLAEQRVRMQQEYEEEQEKKKRKEMEQSAKNQEMVRQAEERRREAERKRREEEERENEAMRQQYEQERQARLEQDCRSESPPIPAVQKRLGYQQPDRQPSADRQHSAQSAYSVSPPASPPVPARRNQIREERQGVISELSSLRRRLRSEQRRLEEELLQPHREDSQSPLTSRHREHPPLDVFDMARLRMQVPARRPPSNTRTTNKHNIQDFNQLKYRDGESREEVRLTYPEPPSDDASLEIQQQALLREQQRRLVHLRRARTNDYFDLSSPMKAAQLKQGKSEGTETHAPLQSESAFIDPTGHTFLTSPPANHRAGTSSARERRRLARRQDAGERPGRDGFREGGRPTPASANSLRLETLLQRNHRRLRALDDMSEPDWRSGEMSTDEGDDLWQQTPPPGRRISTATVATEPWLRPGTTETVKRWMAGCGGPSRNPVQGGWEGPATYHG